MKQFRQLLILCAALLLISCEKNEDDYNPTLENTDELVLEFSRLSSLLNGKSAIIDTCTVTDVFNNAAASFGNSYLNIDVLLEDAQKKLLAESDSSGNKARLEKLITSMNASKTKWVVEQNQIEEIKQAGIKPFLYFNKLYLHLISYNYTTGLVNKVVADYNILNANIQKLGSISRVTQRNDYEYIINYGVQIRSLKKIHTFARVASQTYIMKFSTEIISSNKDSLLITYRSLDAAKNNEELYDLYIKPHFSFSITGERFSFQTLSMFAQNGQRIVAILNAFNQLRWAYATFENNFAQFVTDKPQLKQHSTAIEAYTNAAELIDSLYEEHSKQFAPMVYFGNNTDSLVRWKSEFIALTESTDPLYLKYESKDTVDNNSDVASIELLEGRLQQLYNEYSRKEWPYSYFFAVPITEILSIDDTSTLGGKISALIEKTK
jgi:hypothetical protein